MGNQAARRKNAKGANFGWRSAVYLTIVSFLIIGIPLGGWFGTLTLSDPVR